MDIRAISSTFVLITAILGSSESSHFRGGTVSWKHISSDGTTDKIEVSYRFGWRLNSSKPACNEALVRDQTPLYSEGTWKVEGSSATVDLSASTKTILCTTFETVENWAYGYNSFPADVTSHSGPFQISYTGNAWIADLYGGASGNWAVPTTIDLGVRSDTGKVNNPPTTFSTPIIRLQQGCPSTIEIKYVDADNDRVTCRYATNSVVDECGGVCGATYPHFQLDQNACTISYDGLGGTYLIAVPLMLEDHPSQTIQLGGSRQVTTSDSLSKVPLQFIVNVASGSAACNVVVDYPPDSPDENTTVSIPKSGEVDVVVYAIPSVNTASITQFIIVGPLGVVTSQVFSAGQNLYASNITWDPNENQVGKNIICYQGVDSAGTKGKSRCFNVEVSAIDNPCEVDNGGCNDICIAQNLTRECNCTDECWDLLDNKQTCAPPMDVTCDGESIEIVIPECASTRTIVAGTSEDHFVDDQCQSILENSTHVLEFSPLQCGVTIWAHPVKFIYGVDVWFWHATDFQSPIITRGEWRKIPVTCSLSANDTVERSFVPELPYNHNYFPDQITIDGMGKFSFFFDFYTSGNYSTALDPSDYPLQVTVNDRMYFTLGAVGHGNLIFFTEECVASTIGSSGSTTLTYKFIENGCLLDTTLKRHQSPTIMEDRISLEAFEFEDKLLSRRADAEILIECLVMLCDSSNNSTRCYQGCQSERRPRNKRSSDIIRSRFVREVDDDDDEEIVKITISESPLQKTSKKIVLTGRKPTSMPDEISDSNRYTNWILIGIAILVLIAITVIAWRVIGNKRRNNKTSDEVIIDARN